MSVLRRTDLLISVVGVLTVSAGACDETSMRLAVLVRGGGRLAVAWEAGPGAGQGRLVTEGKRPSVYRIDGSGALVRRDARSGKVIWRREAPAGVRWTAFQVGRTHVAVNGAPRENGPGKKGAFASVAVADGNLLWKKAHRSPARLGIGRGGGGMVLDGGPLDAAEGVGAVAAGALPQPCEVVAVDPATGAEVSRRFGGRKFVRRSGGTGRFACRPLAQVLDRRKGLTVVAHHQVLPRGKSYRAPLRLTGWSSPSRQVWMKPIGYGPLSHIIAVPPLGVVRASILRTLVLLGLNPTTGRVAWRKNLRSGKNCPWSVIHVRPVPGPAKGLALFAQRCHQAKLFDVSTGKVLWEHKTDVITAVVGERPLGWPPRPLRVTPQFRKTWFREVRWVAPDGEVKGHSPLPSTASEVFLVPEGVLVGARSAKGVELGLVDRRGVLLWSRPPTWNVWLVHPYVVVGEALIRLADGRPVGTVGPGKILGLTPAPRILVVEDGGRLRGLRIPGER